MLKLIHKRHIVPLVLIILGLITRFAFIWHPNEIVFDEVHFGKYVEGYLTGNYFFDIHPPLGKLIVTLGAVIGGFDPEFSFTKIGEHYPDYSFIFLRFFPNLFGALIPASIYYFVLSINGSKRCAAIAGLAVLLENAILTQSHYILLDSIYIFFGFTGLTFYFYYRKNHRNLYLVFISGVLLTLSVSIKWTAISFLGIAWLISYVDLDALKFRLNRAVPLLVSLLLIPLIIYYLIFILHFTLLHKSGTGDAFMSPQFKKTLTGSGSENNHTISASSNIEKFLELNKTMLYSNRGISVDHPFASKFYEWPLMVKPIFYWFSNNSEGRVSRIYLFGNPFVWFAALGAFLLGVFFWHPENRQIKWILYSGWIFNMLPFANITRPLFLYHYFPALIFSIIVMSFFITDNVDITKRKSIIIIGAIITAFLIGFLYFLPLTYGLPMTSESFEMRLWLDAWR